MPIPFEVNKARSVLRVNRMAPPVDILSLLRKYADVEFASIPVDADAVCLNLKRPGIRTKIILNEDRPRKRMRFTMAHELGHVLIPWHRGTIVDDVSPSVDSTSSYWEIEAEANRFASELLMPDEWLLTLLRDVEDLGELTRRTSNEADVSLLAAAIRLRSSLPSGVVFAELDLDNVVQRSWRSPGTVANEPRFQSIVDPSSEFPFSTARWSLNAPNTVYWWWRLPASLGLPEEHASDWRSILKVITTEFTDDIPSQKKAYASISATAANANSVSGASKEEVYAAMVQRFSSKAKFDSLFRFLMDHPLVDRYMSARASTF